MRDIPMWMIRNPQGLHIEELLEVGIVGIGWPFAAQRCLDEGVQDRDDFYRIVQESYPEFKRQRAINAGGQLYRFFHEIINGETIISYDAGNRLYYVGKITGEIKIRESDFFSVYRVVEWGQQVSRDDLTQRARNSLGSSLTVFRPAEEAIIEIQALLNPKNNQHQNETVDENNFVVEDPFEGAEEKSKELIKDLIITLEWSQMEKLVAGILRAMGYQTRVSAVGRDRGCDIIASPDGLSLEHPRIFVEVKHRKGQMGAPDIRQFMGGRNVQNDRCLYVSTGGFTHEAKYEAERANVPLTLIDIDLLADLLIEYYDKADPETRTLIPLKKTYWPV